MNEVNLCPSQQTTHNAVVAAAQQIPLLNVWTRAGMGRSTLLRSLRDTLDGDFYTMRQIVQATSHRHPLALEEALYQTLREAFAENPVVILDDWQALADVVSGCGQYPRAGYLDAVALAIHEIVLLDPRRRLIVGSDQGIGGAFQHRAYRHGFDDFSIEDYCHLYLEFGAPTLENLDMRAIHRYAPRLNGYQLQGVARHARYVKDWTTDRFIEYLTSRELVSNVELPEVAPVRFEDLVGMDELVEQLMANVVFPLEDDPEVQMLQLRPKRGVLLLGPPGTGKTSVGRALAHRLRGKFFLVDGTVISGTHYFYHEIQSIIERAKDNAPAVVFIDDSDVIFENQKEHGLYRYLLTVLDGLESQSLERICIVMTAMDLRNIPPALIRSGRVELWLETRLPDESARRELIRRLTESILSIVGNLDLLAMAQATDKCSAADLKRLVNDAKTTYAWARKRGIANPNFTDCFLEAAGRLLDMKNLYAHLPSLSSTRGPRPAWFDVMPDSGTISP